MHTIIQNLDTTKNCEFKYLSLKKVNLIDNKNNKINYEKINICNSKELDVVEFLINKNIDFLINPFSFDKRAFDNSTISIIKKNNIMPIILLDEIKNLNYSKSAYFLKNATLFSNLCKKKKIPLVIDSGGIYENKTTKFQELYNYIYFGYTINQAEMMNNIFGEKYEKKY